MAVGRMVPIGKKSPVPPKRRPKQGILVAKHWGPPFPTLGVFWLPRVPFPGTVATTNGGKTGSGKDGHHRKEVSWATQKKAQTRNFGCRTLGSSVFNFGCILAATGAISRDNCDY